MGDYGWHIGGDYDAWKTTPPPDDDLKECPSCGDEFYGDKSEEWERCPVCQAEQDEHDAEGER